MKWRLMFIITEDVVVIKDLFGLTLPRESFNQGGIGPERQNNGSPAESRHCWWWWRLMASADKADETDTEEPAVMER